MERSNFIKLLEEYKRKAIQEHYNECKVEASLLISGELRQAIAELEVASKTVNLGLDMVQKEVYKIGSLNALKTYCGSFCYSSASTQIFENVISSLASKIRNTAANDQKESEIRNKFDAAIRAAKDTRSPVRLKELADALGIETPEIKVDSDVKAQVDTEFVKEKIKSVLLLS
jgi:hypothetical protein